MIRKQTYIFLFCAILTSLPAVNEVFKDRLVCVEGTLLQTPQAPRPYVSPQPARLLRVQAGEYEPDAQASPCPSTGYGAFVKVSTFLSACLWVCFAGLLVSDIKQGKRRRRRHHRSSRRSSSGTSSAQEGK